MPSYATENWLRKELAKAHDRSADLLAALSRAEYFMTGHDYADAHAVIVNAIAGKDWRNVGNPAAPTKE